MFLRFITTHPDVAFKYLQTECTDSIYTRTAYATAYLILFFLSEFLAEESQEMFWDFVEANQNIEGEHDGKVKAFQPL